MHPKARARGQEASCFFAYGVELRLRRELLNVANLGLVAGHLVVIGAKLHL